MSKVTFTTETGSRYCIDYNEHTFVRLSGAMPPTTRVGTSVRRFSSISELVVGSKVLVNWGEYSATPAAFEGAAPCTITSRVVFVVAPGNA